MRKYLVTKFKCSNCGTTLNLKYPQHRVATHVEGEPTGAEMVEYLVEVVPCDCATTLTEPKDAARITKMVADLFLAYTENNNDTRTVNFK